MKNSNRFRALPSLALLLCAAPTFAALKQSLITAPGGFFQAAAGPSTCGCASWAGDDWIAIFNPPVDAHESAFSGNSSASHSASYSSGNISTSGSGTAAMGHASMEASAAFPSTAFFATGIAHGGWKENFLISNPAYTGQAGFFQFTVNVVGRLDATGVTGASNISTTVYVNNTQPQLNSLSSPGNSDLISTDRQYGNWSIATYGIPPSDGKNVNGTVTYAVPFVFGTQFSVGVYVKCSAGQRSSGGFGDPSTAHTTLSSFTWGGISNIYVGATPVSGSTIVSGTGIDWTQPMSGSCPGDINSDGYVDDSDFVLFVAAYNILDCADPSMPAGCPADLNSDGVVDDADFVVFVGAYNELVCP